MHRIPSLLVPLIAASVILSVLNSPPATADSTDLVRYGGKPEIPAACAAEYNEAITLAVLFEGDFSAPSVEPQTCTVTALALTPRALTILREAELGTAVAPVSTENRTRGKLVTVPRISSELAANSKAASLRRSAEDTLSYGQLRSLANDIAQLIIDTYGADGGLVLESGIDELTGKAHVLLRSHPASLEGLVRASFGTKYYIITVDPNAHPESTTSRAYDGSPHSGGALIYTTYSGVTTKCTSGFMWNTGRPDAIVTAGHCAPNGGVGTIGPDWYEVYSGTRENWNRGVGTVSMNGIEFGDIAMGYVRSGTLAPRGRIYVGGSSSNTLRTVGGKWTRYPKAGDQYCVGGAVTGEACGYVVQGGAPQDIYYSDEHGNLTGEIIKRAWRGRKNSGACTTSGDSGGPLYTVAADGKVWAYGYHSGGSSGSYCTSIFTAQYDADLLLPGNIIIG